MPGEVAVLENLDGIVTGGEIDGIVGGGKEAVIDVDGSSFGSGGGREKAGGLKNGTLAEIETVAAGDEGDKNSAGNDKNSDKEEEKKAFFVGMSGHSNIIT